MAQKLQIKSSAPYFLRASSPYDTDSRRDVSWGPLQTSTPPFSNTKNEPGKILEDKNVINTIIVARRILLSLKAFSLLALNNKLIIYIFKEDFKAII